jgi:general stress protein 26
MTTMPSTTVTPIEYDTIADQTWTRLADAADRINHPMRLQTVASADERGSPDARILVLRGADRAALSLWFHTDRRSRKVDHYRAHPRACTVGYDGRDGVQLRVWGRVSLHDHDEMARRHWEQTDFAVRNAYGLTATPGEPLPHPDPRFEAQRKRIETETEEIGRRNFMVLQLTADAIEWFQTTPTGDRRALMRAREDWVVVPLVP